MSSDSSVTLLGTVIKQLSSSGDEKSREFEKKKIQLDLKNADEKLGELVEENQEHLKKTIQSFGSVVTRVTACRDRIKLLNEKLNRCRTLLYCNRDDLKTHWQEGLECTEKLNLLDKIEKAIKVPEQLDKFIARKHFLHASELLVETVDNLDGTLHSVEALRDLRASLHSQKAILHEQIIDEINKQIYAEPQKSKKTASGTVHEELKKLFWIQMLPLLKEYFRKSKPAKNELQIPIFRDEDLYEDLQRNPEDDVPLFMYLMVESLVRLKKIPEAVEAFKGRIKRDMMTVVRRITDQVAKRAIDIGDVVAIEELAAKEDSQILLDLLEVAFEKFRSIAMNHCILLNALDQAKEKMLTMKANEISLYTKEDIWSKIQFAIKDMLEPYLGDTSLGSAQQALTSFGNVEGAVANFFTARKRLVGPSLTNKTKTTQLFKFECSSSAEALHSYMREQDIASSLPEDTYADFIVWNAPQLLCKPQADNITAMFIPAMTFVKEIDRNTNSNLGSEGVLHNFITQFVEKSFIHKIFFEVTERAKTVTKGHDALRNLCDPSTQKGLFLERPLLKSTIVIFQIIQELLILMKKLPVYSNNFLEMINRILTEYYDTCYTSYKGLVFRESESKVSKVISANWVRDEDIKRLLMSLPNWNNLHNTSVDEEEDEDVQSVRLQQDRETTLLISNLEKQDIEKNQIIIDPLDLKALANLQESLEWLAGHTKTFATNLSALNTSVKVSAFDETDNIIEAENFSDDYIKTLSSIAEEFKELSDSILLVLHLEVRIHCFFFLGKAIRESSYFCNMDSIEVDIQIPQLSKDLKDIEEICSSSLVKKKVRYIFYGLGYLMACIIISSTGYIKKINRNGVKKMCQNIFTIQQELTNITTRREWNLDFARQYFELLYASPDEILTMISEQGAQFKEQDYANAIELLSRSTIPFDEQMWKIRRNKLSEILKEKELEGKKN